MKKVLRYLNVQWLLIQWYLLLVFHFRKLKIYPKGDGGEQGKSLSLYLILVSKNIAPARRLGAWAEFKLLLKNQKHGNDIERKSKININTVTWMAPFWQVI